MPEHRGLIVADDLSGASDTGHQLATRGYPTTVVAGEDSAPSAESVVVVNTDSRYSDPEEAAERVASTAGAYPAQFAYKKVDSTLRGNLIAEISAMLEATGSKFAVAAPAFPSMGRITVGGTHLVEGTPVARTAAGQDPDQPVTDSHVPTLLEGGDFEVAHVGIDDAASGAGTVAERLRSVAAETDGTGTGATGTTATVAVCDAATDDHLAAIAEGAAALDERVAYVGSGGLARHVRVDAGASAGVLGIAGSASPRTFEQLSALDDGVVIEMDGEKAMTDRDAAVEAAADRAVAVMESESRAVVTAAQSPDDVEATLAAAEAAGLTNGEARERIASVLADCAAAVHQKRGFGSLFVTGGAVATTVLDALGGTGIRLTGHAVGDGVPLGRIDGGVVDGAPLVTKAGAFGGDDTIVKAVDYLTQYDDGR